MELTIIMLVLLFTMLQTYISIVMDHNHIILSKSRIDRDSQYVHCQPDIDQRFDTFKFIQVLFCLLLVP